MHVYRLRPAVALLEAAVVPVFVVVLVALVQVSAGRVNVRGLVAVAVVLVIAAVLRYLRATAHPHGDRHGSRGSA